MPASRECVSSECSRNSSGFKGTFPSGMDAASRLNLMVDNAPDSHLTTAAAALSYSRQRPDSCSPSFRRLDMGGVRGAGATMVAGPAAGGQIVCEEMPGGPSIEGGGP